MMPVMKAKRCMQREYSCKIIPRPNATIAKSINCVDKDHNASASDSDAATYDIP